MYIYTKLYAQSYIIIKKYLFIEPSQLWLGKFDVAALSDQTTDVSLKNTETKTQQIYEI